MIYRIRSQKLKVKSQKSSQAGVTLLLAILILSSVLAISFSLATILLVEVRTSGDLARTEPALYGANGVTEEALFKIKRNVSDSQFPAFSGNVSHITVDSQIQTLHDPILQVKVPAASRVEFSFHDPNNLSGPGNYGKLTITYLPTNSSNPVKVYICQIDPLVPPSDPSYDCDNLSSSNPSMLEANTSLSPSLLSKSWSNLDPDKQQELILINEGTSADLYVKLESFGPDRVTRKGPPYFAEKAVDIDADNSGVARRVRVLVPTD